MATRAPTSTPTSPRRVPRPALYERLEAATAGPVTVVAAPAGSGKTVLVRSWLEGRGPAPVAAWVSVERGEGDAQHFWTTVVGELCAAGPAGVTIEKTAPTPEYDGDGAVARLAADLAPLAGPLILVIDDLHEIDSPDIQRQLAYFLEHLPGQLHVVLISRRDPQLGLHRRRLEGELVEIRHQELQFSLDETRQMMGSLGVELSETGLGLLHERTEGWVAGLRLAAVSLSNHPDPEQFVLDFSGSERTVAEYLLAEVLDSQTTEVRHLLLRTSLLERVNGELGDLLTGSAGSERHLQALADSGAFVIALDPGRTWFRFHHLFADLLSLELRHTEPTEVPGLHRAAWRWYADHGYVLEAIAHALSAGDHREAAGLLISHYFSLTLDGRQASAHALLEQFPPDSFAASPEIALVMANDELAQGSLDQAAAHLALAEQNVDLVPALRRSRFDRALFVTRLSLARHLGDFGSVLDGALLTEVLDEPQDSHDVAIHNDVRTLVLMNLGIAEVWSGHPDDGARHLGEGAALAGRIGRPYLEVGCRANLAQAESWRSFTRGRQSSRDVLAAADDHGWGTDPVVAPALVTLGTCLIQAGRIDEGEHWLDRAATVVRTDLEPAVGYLLHMSRALAQVVRGHHAEALDSAQAGRQLGRRLVGGTPLTVQMRSVSFYARLGAGDIGAVRDAVGRMSEAERDAADARELLAAVALAEGDPDTAVGLLAPTLAGSVPVHHPVVLVRSLLLEGRGRQARGESRAAEEAVERALEVAEPDSLILPFMFVKATDLLEHHPHHRTAHGAFLEEVGDVLSGLNPSPDRTAPAPALDTLSDAELRVLRYLPTNLTATDIAGQIYVTTNTVKTHMRHIYAKLDVHTRLEAVERARALGLLGHSTRTD